MARSSWSGISPEARAMVAMVQAMGRIALAGKQIRRRPPRPRVRKLSKGDMPASVAWCHQHLAPLRGHQETTTLPVGQGIESLRHGLACLERVWRQGAIVDWPIAFVVQRAQRLPREH